MSAPDQEFDIAIVGMACRFPGARDLEEFWRNLDGGVDSIRHFTVEELVAAGVRADLAARPDYVRASPVLEDPALFDAAFFGFSPAEAAALDPQHRLLLELTQAALDDAGCAPGPGAARIGVFAGSAMNSYFVDRGMGSEFAANYLPTLLASDKDFLATRLSYKFGLKGPSLTVQSACSTSLVAVHLARQSLLSEECDAAVAAAVSVRVPHLAGYLYDGSGVVSRDGRIRAFDAGANGTVFGSGAGVVVLKRLEDARAQGDRIYAVIKGSAVNNDGAEKAGYSAPSVGGQADAVVEALANAGLSAEDLSYVEAHGSGTPVGDRIELQALTSAFRRFTPRNGFCALGSVKTNVGHLDAAAGMAGLIKTALALRHGRIPATLHFSAPNPEIDFAHSPFRVAATALDWPRGDTPRRAGVMATGMGGTNAHVVLEEAPEPLPAAAAAERPQLFVLSARSPSAVAAAAERFAAWMEPGAPGEHLAAADVARTLQRGRRPFAHRRAAVASSAPAAARLLADGNRALAGEAPPEGPAEPVFLLPGIGDHFAGMSRGLYERFPVFRAEIDRCAELLRPRLGCDPRELLYSPTGDAAAAPGRLDLRRLLARGEGEDPAAAGPLHRTRFCQPILFMVEYAAARLWMEAGIVPARLIGHSLGEWVAACLAGVFRLEDALRLVATRAELVDALPQGAMTAVMLGEAELLPLLGADLAISLINGPKLCVVAGPAEPMEGLRAELKRRGAIFRAVRGGHPFHTPRLDAIAEPLRAALRATAFSRPRLPFASNVTGNWITPEQATDPEYWVQHACRTARFDGVLQRLWETARPALVEVGPGRTLGVLAFQHPARGSRKPLSVATLRAEYETGTDAEVFLTGAGRLWTAGASLAWDRLEPEAGRTVALPSYPFERQRHWLQTSAAEEHPGRTKALADWFFVPYWERSPLPAAAGAIAPAPLWLIVDPGDAPRDFGNALAAELARQNADVVTAPPAADWPRVLASLRPRLRASGLNILHLGGLSARVNPAEPGAPVAQELGFHSVFALAQALGEAQFSTPVRLVAATAPVHVISGDETPAPALATVSGLAGVISREYPRIVCLAVDLDSKTPATALVRECEGAQAGAVIALRGGHRWRRGFRSERMGGVPPPGLEGSRLRRHGVYVITGGTGGLGMAIARHLAEVCAARLVLLARHAPGPGVQAALREIERLGGTVETWPVDVTDPVALAPVLAAVRERLGAIHGVIHAAGLQRDAMLEIKTREECAAHLAPKVAGTAALHALLSRAAPPDFLVLFSSLSSVVAHHGQADYAAANAFLDAFAIAQEGRAPFPTLAVNWPAWAEVGMGVRSGTARGGILTADGVEAFRRALRAGRPQVVVSPRELAAVEEAAAQAPVPARRTAAPVAGAAPAPAAMPRDDVERAVAGMWQTALGGNASGIHDDFIAAGGHSLLAMRIVAQIRAAYAIDFTLRKFFAAPTIAGNAAAIQEAVLAEVENLSDEEVERRTA